MSRQLPSSVQAVIGGDSEPEARLLRRLARAGLPTPETQQRLIAGRKFRFDVSYPEPFKIAVEVQGGMRYSKATIADTGAHGYAQGFESDSLKSALAQIDGWVVIAVTPGMISSGLAVDLISRALLARGWPGLS